MKKIFFVVIVIMCFFLCACNMPSEEKPSDTPSDEKPSDTPSDKKTLYKLKIENYYPTEDLELQFEYQQIIDLPVQEYDKEKYTFLGFDIPIPNEMPANDLLIIGSWETVEIEQVRQVTVYTDNNENTIHPGEKIQLYFKILPENANIESAKWMLNNDAYGTITQDGLFTAGTNVGIVKIIYEVNDSINVVRGAKNIQIVAKEKPVYPTLEGYTIKIAVDSSSLGVYNPFMPVQTKDKYGYYDGPDREARQQAWLYVESKFDCHIETVEYPSDATWGQTRWNYIINHTSNNTSEYDIYTVPSSCISSLADANAIYDLTSWYNQYGSCFMSESAVKAGTYKEKLYTIDWNAEGSNNECWVLAVGKYDKSRVGQNIPEKVYYAIVTYFQVAKDIYENGATYNVSKSVNHINTNKYFSIKLDAVFYDPMTFKRNIIIDDYLCKNEK